MKKGSASEPVLTQLMDGKIVEDVKVDKRDVVELMKHRLEEKYNQEIKSLCEAKDKKIAARTELKKKIAEKAAREITKHFEPRVKEINDAFDKLGLKQKAFVSFGKERETLIDGLTNGKAKVRITTDINCDPMDVLMQFHEEMMFFMRGPWFCGGSRHHRHDSKSFAFIQQELEYAFSKETVDEYGEVKTMSKEIEDMEAAVNKMHNTLCQVRNDASKLNVMLTEQVLGESSDGKKLLDVINAMIENNFNAGRQLPA